MENKYGSWALFALVAAAILSYMTFNDYRKGAALEKDGVETTGTVSDIEEIRGRRGRITYTPVVSFTDESGNACSLKTDGSRSSNYRVGQEVKIVYLPNNSSVGDMADNNLMDRAKFFMAISAVLWVLTLIFGALYLKTRSSQDVTDVAPSEDPV